MYMMSFTRMSVVVVFVLGTILAAHPARAHCDTADGPVVADAKVALEKGDVTPNKSGRQELLENIINTFL